MHDTIKGIISILLMQTNTAHRGSLGGASGDKRQSVAMLLNHIGLTHPHTTATHSFITHSQITTSARRQRDERSAPSRPLLYIAIRFRHVTDYVIIVCQSLTADDSAADVFGDIRDIGGE